MSRETFADVVYVGMKGYSHKTYQMRLDWILYRESKTKRKPHHLGIGFGPESESVEEKSKVTWSLLGL